MKTVRILAVLIAIFAVAGTSWGKSVVDAYRTVERGGLKYYVNSEIPFTGKAVKYWPNGQKMSEIEYRNGELYGKWIEWSDKGQKMSEIEYRDGDPYGKAICWYENGQKMSEFEWRDGKMQGKWTLWYENGQKMSEIEYRDDNRISAECWDENGNSADCEDVLPWRLRASRAFINTEQGE